MIFSKFYVTRRTRTGSFLNQIDQLIDWVPIKKAIAQHYAPVSDAAGRPAYSGYCYSKCYWEESSMVVSAMKR